MKQDILRRMARVFFALAFCGVISSTIGVFSLAAEPTLLAELDYSAFEEAVEEGHNTCPRFRPCFCLTGWKV